MKDYRNSILYKLGNSIQTYIDKGEDDKDRRNREKLMGGLPFLIGGSIGFIIAIVSKIII